ncbi:MAG: LacI family DNA-binding transcriptional regulator [Aggregatilineales bacterium]
MDRNHKITLADIAQEAGVSKQTVSRVVNNHPDVGRRTRDKIQTIIDRIGYQPNLMARSLSARQSHIIGVIIARLDQFGPSTVLMEIDREAHAAGYRVIPYIIHDDDMSDADKHLGNLMTFQPDGIVWAMTREDTSPESLEQQNIPDSIPIVTTNMDIINAPSAFVIDEVDSSKCAVNHLIEQNYRKIGIITGPLNWSISHKRLAGWRQALADADLPNHDAQIVEGNWTASSGEQGMVQLFDQFPDVDAVFACNDQMALGALNVIQSRGIQVPQTLGIVGYDDIPEARYFTPGLTTMHQPFSEYGKIIIQALLKMVGQNQNDEQSIILPEAKIMRPKLIVRGSSLRNG